MPYSLDSNPSVSEVSDAVNYLLSNFALGLTSNPNSGQVIGPTGNVVGYLYKYIAIKYADSQDGSVNFSNVPINRLYYGIRNTDSSTESTNPTDYIWSLVTGGFGTTKILWYAVTGGRQILFAVSASTYNVGYVQDIGVSINLDVITSSLTSDSFGTTFSPATLQVPYTNAPVFTSVISRLYGTNAYGAVDFVASQTDSDSLFVNNSWRIGGSSTTGYGDIVQSGITIGNPTDGGSFAVWPVPSAMASNSATMSVPVRYKDNAGTIRQAALNILQFVFNYSGKNATICYALYSGNPTVTGSAVTKSGTSVPATTDFSPTSATSFTYAVQTPGSSQALFQSDGIYDPIANTSNWNTPYLSNFKVGQLSAITADLGTINAGVINGITINGTTINTGTLNGTTGTFSGNLSAAGGTFSGNLSAAGGTFSGTLTASAVNAVNTINIAGNAVTIPVSAFTSGGVATGSSDVTVQSASINSQGSPLNMSISFFANSTDPCNGILTLKRDGTALLLVSQYFTGGGTVFNYVYSETPSSGSHTYTASFRIDAGTGSVFNRSLVLLGTKR